jgi:hypothetical protein
VLRSRWQVPRTPNQRGVGQSARTQQAQTEALLGLLGKPAFKPDVPLPALKCGGGKAMPGLPCKVSLDGVATMPVLEGVNDGLQGDTLRAGRPATRVSHLVETVSPLRQLYCMAVHQGGDPPPQ